MPRVLRNLKVDEIRSVHRGADEGVKVVMIRALA
jgi:hypothetical protein